VKRTPEFGAYEDEIWKLIASQKQRTPAGV
jgi:hypothetical protein